MDKNNTNPLFIGVSGKIGSGKDTFAELLARICKTPVERHAYADKLREVTELITGYEMTEMSDLPFYNTVYNYTQEQKNIYLPVWDKTIGKCLQVIGTECMRNNFDPDVWVKSLFETVGKKCIEAGHIMVIPDVRFPNEVEYLKKNGGIVFRLEGDPMNVRENSNRDLNHISETALDDYDGFTEIIDNSKPDIDALQKKVIQLMETYQIK
jgi:hypothetical protein